MSRIDVSKAELNDKTYEKAADFFKTGEGAEILDLTTHYAVFVLMPPILAERLLRRGDRRAAARDFECPCYTDPDSDRPICFGLKRNCRFEEERIAPGEKDLEDYMRRSPRTRLQVQQNIRLVLTYLSATVEEKAAMTALMRRTKARFLRKGNAAASGPKALRAEPAPPLDPPPRTTARTVP